MIGKRSSLKDIVPHGLKEGMSVTRPADSRRYYVIAGNGLEFARWVKLRGKNLQACIYLGTVEGMKGLSFANPEIELVVVGAGWKEKGEAFWEAAHALISRYCLDKRKHDCLRDDVYGL